MWVEYYLEFMSPCVNSEDVGIAYITTSGNGGGHGGSVVGNPGLVPGGHSKAFAIPDALMPAFNEACKAFPDVMKTVLVPDGAPGGHSYINLENKGYKDAYVSLPSTHWPSSQQISFWFAAPSVAILVRYLLNKNHSSV